MPRSYDLPMYALIFLLSDVIELGVPRMGLAEVEINFIPPLSARKMSKYLRLKQKMNQMRLEFNMLILTSA